MINTGSGVMTDTKKTIVESAKKLFISKGFKGTTMRHIAQDVGVNLALINYYFRSKEGLFDIVFYEIFGKLFSANGNILYSHQPYDEKIRHVVENYFEMLQEDPQIPMFLLGELSHNPDLIVGKFKDNKLFGVALHDIKSEIDKAVTQGYIKPIDPIHLTINIVALSVFPFMAKPLISELATMTECGSFEKLMENRKEIVYRFIIDAIKA